MALQMSRRAIIQNGRLASIVDKGPYVQSHHFISHSNLPRPQRWNSNRNLWWNATFRMRLRRGEPNSESAGAVDRFAQPFHCELDVLRLQLAPALDLDLVALFRKALEIFRCQLLAAVRSVNFSRMNGSFGFDP